MKSIKMFGLAGAAVIAAMAVFGVSSASATNTALCNTHEDPCGDPHKLGSIHAVSIGSLFILTSTADVLCLSALLTAAVLALGNPQKVHTESFLLEACGTNAAHNNCTVGIVEELPLFNLLKTALNLGVLVAENGFFRVTCTILGFVKIACTYKMAGLTLAAEGALHSGVQTGHGMFSANNFALVPGEGPTCPTTSSLDVLLEPLVHSYITS